MQRIVKQCGAIAIFAVVSAAMSVAQAGEAFPARTVHLVTALPAGSDAYVRVLAERLTQQLGQSVVVDNRPGGAWAPAALAVSGSRPDGHNLLVYSVVILISKNVQPKLPYDPIGDFAPIAKIYGDGASVLYVSPTARFKNVQELIAHAKANPGKVNHGGGFGTSSHLQAASFLAIAGATGFHVPFRGPGDDLPALLRGDIDFGFTVTTVVLPQVLSGKLRALAVTSCTRVKALPDVPTLREVLNNDLLIQENWTGFAASVKTPREIITRWHAETVKVIADPAMLKVIESGGNLPAPAESPEQFGKFIQREFDKWREVVKLSGMKLD
ncbi:MAG: Bug family tripartite tricarboxylate transporter substrate binding protein [Burkholderiales bacterium]